MNTVPTKRTDELDNLLHSFFHAEMPEPFPDLEFPSVLQMHKPAPKRRSLLHSRMALAASILLLLLGGWLVSSSMGQDLLKNTLGFQFREAKQQNPHDNVPVPPNP